MTFGEYVNAWYERQDLAVSTMQNYRRTIEDHLLPAFQDFAVAAISPTDVALWEKRERALGYAEASIRLWRTTLHLILADAVDEGLRESNPAARRRGRGKRDRSVAEACTGEDRHDRARRPVACRAGGAAVRPGRRVHDGGHARLHRAALG
jgi:hypothetical protein